MQENGIAPGSSAASSSSTSSSSSDEEFEDDEFSFHRFSVLHFQGDATHTHISQRLREPLLRHDDEGDALVRRGGRKDSEEFWWSKNVISSSFPGLSYCLVAHTAFYGRPAGTDVSRNTDKWSEARLA